MRSCRGPHGNDSCDARPSARSLARTHTCPAEFAPPLPSYPPSPTCPRFCVSLIPSLPLTCLSRTFFPTRRGNFFPCPFSPAPFFRRCCSPLIIVCFSPYSSRSLSFPRRISDKVPAFFPLPRSRPIPSSGRIFIFLEKLSPCFVFPALGVPANKEWKGGR